MAENAILLDRGWTFRAVEPSEYADFASHQVPPNLSRNGWLGAAIPGTVHLDLMSHDKIPNPYKEQNDKDVSWVEAQDYLYRTTFNLPGEWLHSAGKGKDPVRIELACESLDTFADIYVNNKHVGESRNAFLPCALDVSDAVQEGTNTVIIHFTSAAKKCADLEKETGRLVADFDRTRVQARRPQYLTGWDIAPRLSGCGIWGNVVVRRVPTVRVKSIFVPVQSLSRNSAEITIQTDVEALGLRVAMLTWTLEKLEPVGSGTKHKVVPLWETSRTFTVRKGSFRYAESIGIENPILWWPAGYGPGRRTLYCARVTIRVDNELVDSSETVFGIRSVELLGEDPEWGEEFCLKINGQAIFARGANWVPPDMFPPRVIGRDVRRLLDAAASANVNILRVWGGGYYESEAFYRRCDELGIMVWQDFMFSRGEYPEAKDYWANVQKEVTHQIRRLRNHPSIVLWCGNDAKEWTHFKNDGSVRNQLGGRIFTKMIPHLVREYDPSRPYWRSSPHGGTDPNDPNQGDHHAWSVWNGWEPIDRYRHLKARFITEFGVQSLPCEETIASFSESKDKTLNHPSLEAHQKQVDGNVRLFRYLIARCRPPESFEELVYLSQWMQAEALTLAIDSWRAAKPRTMGALVWHWNDCWPGISWSILDHRGRAKLAYWAVRRAFAPTNLVMIEAEEGLRVVALHDGPALEGDQEMVCRLKVYTLDGELVEWKDHNITVPANDKVEVGTFSLRSLGVSDPMRCVIVGELIRHKVIIATKLYSPVEARKVPFPEPKLECQLDCVLNHQRAVYVVRSQNVVRGVEMNFEKSPNTRVRYDNGFDIWPGCEVWVQVDIGTGTETKQLLNGVRFRCLNDAVPGSAVAWRNLPVTEGEGRAADASVDSDDLTVRLKTRDMIPKLDF